MATRDEQRAQATERVVAHLLKSGFSEASLRQLASAAGVSDRMLLYYFRDKTEVLSAAMKQVAGQLIARLVVAIPDGTKLPPRRFLALAIDVTTSAAMRPYMRLWTEIVAEAARGEPAASEVTAQLADGFMQWIEARLSPADPQARRALAAATFAVINGMASLEVCAGPDLTARAAGAMDALLGR